MASKGITYRERINSFSLEQMSEFSMCLRKAQCLVKHTFPTSIINALVMLWLISSLVISPSSNCT